MVNRKKKVLKDVGYKEEEKEKQDKGIISEEDFNKLEKAKQDTGKDYVRLFEYKRLKFLEMEKDSEILRIQPPLENKKSEEVPPIFIEIFRDIDSKLKGEKLEEGFIKKVLTFLAQKDGRRKATELIEKGILKEKRIYTIRDDKEVEMWIYNEGIYIPQGKTYIKEFCRKILGDVYTPYLSSEVISKIEVDTYIDDKIFFGKNIVEEIAVENGILDLKTKKLNPFTEDKIFFNKLPITYDSSKKCKNISKFLKEVLKNKEDVPVMVELFGFLLWKNYTIEKAFMFCGDGRNGKGKTLELMKRFLGAENCVNIPIQDFQNDSFSLGELFGKLANLSGDIDKRALYQTGNFKNITGRDTISASRKFLPKIHFQNYAKQIFCANELPISYDNTIAFWNRWVLFEFPYTFLSEKELDKISDREKGTYKLADPEIIDKIATDDELSGLLNLAVNSLKNLLEQKDFSYSKNTAEVKDMWIRKSDSFSAFCMDCIEENFDGKITKSELRRAYSIYCKNHKVSMSGDKTVKFSLTTNFAVTEDRDRKEGSQIPFWSGIIFKSGMGGIDGKGFSTLGGVTNFPIGLNKVTTHTTLTKFDRAKPTQKTHTTHTFKDDNKQFKALENIDNLVILKDRKQTNLNLKKGKIYTKSDLGDRSDDILKILLDDKKIEPIVKQNSKENSEKSDTSEKQ